MMNPWTRIMIIAYFIGQLTIRTLFSESLSSQTEWALYWILFGMGVVMIFDNVAGKISAKMRSARPDPSAPIPR